MSYDYDPIMDGPHLDDLIIDTRDVIDRINLMTDNPPLLSSSELQADDQRLSDLLEAVGAVTSDSLEDGVAIIADAFFWDNCYDWETVTLLPEYVGSYVPIEVHGYLFWVHDGRATR